MTIITGANIPLGNQILWHAGGVHVPFGSEVQEEGTPGNQQITLDFLAEYGSVLTHDLNDAETPTCLEFQICGEQKATQATGTKVIETNLANDVPIFPDYINIATPLTEVFATKDVKFSVAMDEFAEPVQEHVNKVRATGESTWNMTVTAMHYNLAFIGLVLGTTIADSPEAGWTKHQTASEGVKELGTLVGKRYESGILTAKYFAIGCRVKLLSEEFPASGFLADSFDFTVSSKREIFKA